MIIDTHAHVVPDRVAAKVAEVTAERFARAGMSLHGPITTDGLAAAMERGGIARSCLFCVAEKPSVVRPANDFVAQFQGNPRFILMGTVHPDTEDVSAEFGYLRRKGFKGVKFHSIFQDFYPDEERMFPLYEAMQPDLIAYFHAGADPAHPEREVKATPERVARVIELFPRLTVVAAHFGGMLMVEEASKHLFGKDLFLDTCYCRGVKTLGREEVARIVAEHGSERVLFASDYPMADPGTEAQWIEALPMPEQDRENILFRNAQSLFGL